MVTQLPLSYYILVTKWFTIFTQLIFVSTISLNPPPKKKNVMGLIMRGHMKTRVVKLVKKKRNKKHKNLAMNQHTNRTQLNNVFTHKYGKIIRQKIRNWRNQQKAGLKANIISIQWAEKGGPWGSTICNSVGLLSLSLELFCRLFLLIINSLYYLWSVYICGLSVLAIIVMSHVCMSVGMSVSLFVWLFSTSFCSSKPHTLCIIFILHIATYFIVALLHHFIKCIRHYFSEKYGNRCKSELNKAFVLSNKIQNQHCNN